MLSPSKSTRHATKACGRFCGNRLRSSRTNHSRDATNLAVSDRLCVFMGGTLMRRLLLASVLGFVIPAVAPCQTSHRVAIRAGKLIDGKSEKAVENIMIVVEGDKIASVTAGGSAPAGVEVIDLSKATVLPGFIDTHTHVLLQGDITAEEYDTQLLKQSIPYRAILAARNAHIALSHGFTAMRDLETEGAMYADVDVKKAIANGEVPGPRMQVATRAMAPTGMYPLFGYSWELKMPRGVQFVDGVDEARKAVREQVMYGADWIKYYSDRREHFEADGRLHSRVNFTDEEALAIVEEAHRLGKKVAAHAVGSDGIAAALRAGVDTIEHGDGLTDVLMDEMVRTRSVLGADAYSRSKPGTGTGGVLEEDFRSAA